MSVKFKTITNDLSALHKICSTVWFESNYSAMPQLHILLQGIKQVKGVNTPEKRHPITIELLQQMKSAFDLKNYDQLVKFTAIVTTTVGLLRTCLHIDLYDCYFLFQPFSSKQPLELIIFVRIYYLTIYISTSTN